MKIIKITNSFFLIILMLLFFNLGKFYPNRDLITRINEVVIPMGVWQFEPKGNYEAVSFYDKSNNKIMDNLNKKPSDQIFFNKIIDDQTNIYEFTNNTNQKQIISIKLYSCGMEFYPAIIIFFGICFLSLWLILINITHHFRNRSKQRNSHDL